MPSRLSYFVFHRLERVLAASTPLLLVITALIFFLANTLPVSVIISLTEGKSPRKVWSECYFWSFPYYLVGAAVVFLVDFVNKHTGWQTTLLVLPVIYWVYRSYRLYLTLLEAEKDTTSKRRSATWKMSLAALANDRSSGAGDRSERPHDA